MLPYLFHLPQFDAFGLSFGQFSLPSFGIMVLTGVLLSRWVFFIEFRRKDLDSELVDVLVIAAIACGIVGGKLYFVLFELPPYVSWAEVFGNLFSGGGLTWYGGLLLAMVVFPFLTRWYNTKLLSVLDVLGLVAPLGYALGRIGCQLAGDGDYGVPTTVPWAMSYPIGIVPTLELVHPTPIYEALAGFLLFLILWSIRKRFSTDGVLFFIYLIGAGVSRVCVEFIRINPIALLGLTDAQLISLLMIVLGTVGILARNRLPARHQN
jgi:phosphatidylglycerol:prolipoprotein diacylglycerol transferase